MNTTAASARKAPRFLWASVIVAALIVPAFFVIDRMATPGGDGLQSFWAVLFTFVGCALASLVCAAVGLIRGERPRWLAAVAIALCCAPVMYLGF